MQSSILVTKDRICTINKFWTLLRDRSSLFVQLFSVHLRIDDPVRRKRLVKDNTFPLYQIENITFFGWSTVLEVVLVVCCTNPTIICASYCYKGFIFRPLPAFSSRQDWSFSSRFCNESRIEIYWARLFSFNWRETPPISSLLT